jgi:3-oxoacid CoA-transferase subunit A/glutaconate CoA-transferase subunit A
MDVLEEGKGELLAWHDPDEQRGWVRENKPRNLKDKRMSLREAVSRFVHDGDYLALGGFGHVRTSMIAVYEIVRQKIRDLTVAANPGVHDTDILIAGSCVSKVEAAYAFGHELRGLSPCSRRAVESGRVEVAAEISNAGLQWRFRAAAMGLPFLPTRVMLGTDTFRQSSAKAVRDPFTGRPICLVPACYPDVAIIHVHRCDLYGNSQIDGITVKDLDLARAARRLIITTEEIVSEEETRERPWMTVIPFFVVDAVVEARYGVHPGNMPYLYYSDEEHMAEWLRLSRTPEGVDQYLEKYVYGVEDFEEYLRLVGGDSKLEYLRRLENLEVSLRAPWIGEGRS